MTRLDLVVFWKWTIMEWEQDVRIIFIWLTQAIGRYRWVSLMRNLEHDQVCEYGSLGEESFPNLQLHETIWIPWVLHEALSYSPLESERQSCLAFNWLNTEITLVCGKRLGFWTLDFSFLSHVFLSKMRFPETTSMYYFLPSEVHDYWLPQPKGLFFQNYITQRTLTVIPYPLETCAYTSDVVMTRRHKDAFSSMQVFRSKPSAGVSWVP
jgi:hypothetical protein